MTAGSSLQATKEASSVSSGSIGGAGADSVSPTLPGATANLGKTHRLLPLLLPVALVALWQSLSTAHLLPRTILPSPSDTLTAAAQMSRSGDLWRNLAVSGARAGAGLAIGGSLGFLAGIFTGASRFAERLLDPTVQMLRTIPNLALIPLVILWMGIGEEAKVLLIAVGVFFPLYVNTYQGVRTVDAGLVEMARSYGLGGVSLFWNVLLPGALPSVLTGLRFSLGTAWLTLIAAEGLAADSGIGYMTTTAREFMQTDRVLVGVLLYAVLGIVADQSTRLLERRLLQWHSSYISRPAGRQPRTEPRQ